MSPAPGGITPQSRRAVPIRKSLPPLTLGTLMIEDGPTRRRPRPGTPRAPPLARLTTTPTRQLMALPTRIRTGLQINSSVSVMEILPVSNIPPHPFRMGPNSNPLMVRRCTPTLPKITRTRDTPPDNHRNPASIHIIPPNRQCRSLWVPMAHHHLTAGLLSLMRWCTLRPMAFTTTGIPTQWLLA